MLGCFTSCSFGAQLTRLLPKAMRVIDLIKFLFIAIVFIEVAVSKYG
jgi:hypothetical protein